jgi:FtsZ-binding cell division protein ZapB
MADFYTILGSVMLSLIGTAIVVGRYREKVESLERGQNIQWKEINELKKTNTSIQKSVAELTVTLTHLERSINELKEGNHEEFEKIASLITALGVKLSDNYIRKEDMHLWMKKDK